MKSSRLTVSFVFVLCLLSCAAAVLAQPKQETVAVIVTPDHPDWTYRIGESVEFNVTVLQFGNPLDGVEIRYELREEKMPPLKSSTARLKNGTFKLKTDGMRKPGFLRLWAYVDVDGRSYNGCGTAGFEPERIQPAAEEPDDFDEFWSNAANELASIPMDTRMTLLPDRCTETVDVYHVNLKNYGNSRLYGILCVPKSEGSYPALLRVPGAGIRPYGGNIDMAKKGVITFEIGIHGIPVTMDQGVYSDLGSGALSGYPFFNLDNRDKYYYKRVYLGCIRAVDFIFSLSRFDGKRLAVTGGSQGGALSIVTTALDKRIKWFGAYCPALCDLTGYLDDRAGGWPHMFNEYNGRYHNKPDKIETSGYYDVVNFARRVTVPCLFSWGFNDTTCPPTSMYAAYNVIDSPKSVYLVLDARHWIYPEQSETVNGWLENKLVGDGSVTP